MTSGKSSIQIGLSTLTVDQLQGRPAFVALLRQAQASLSVIAQEMDATVKNSRIKGVPMSLHVETRRDAEKTRFLRWYGYGKNRTWESFADDLGALTAPMRRHYEQLNRRAKELNTLSMLLQHTVRKLEGHLDKRLEQTTT